MLFFVLTFCFSRLLLFFCFPAMRSTWQHTSPKANKCHIKKSPSHLTTSVHSHPHMRTHTNAQRGAVVTDVCVCVSCSPGRPVFVEDLPSSSGPPTPFRALPTSSSPPPFSPSKPCSRQSSSSDTDLSLTPKTGKNTWPRPSFPFSSLPSPTLHIGAAVWFCFSNSVFSVHFLRIF